MNKQKTPTENLNFCVDEYGVGLVLQILAQICWEKATRDAGLDGLDGPEALELKERLKSDSHYGTTLGRAAEWVKMAERIYELSHFYDPDLKCPNFVHPPFENE